METKKKALLVVGSPRGANSASEGIGGYLLSKLAEKGFETNTLRVYPMLKQAQEGKTLPAELYEAELLILAFPLYVDSLPAAVTKFLELLAEKRPLKEQALVAVVNCGFPEAYHCNVAVEICGEFARETGIRFLGGLTLGGGEAVRGKSLEQMGFFTKNVRRSFDVSADLIAEGKEISDEAKRLMAKPLIPYWIYRLIAKIGFNSEAKKNGVKEHISDRPYLSE